MNLPIIIGLCGEIGSGKDAVASYLEEAYGYQRLSWATALKEACYFIYGPLGAERRHFFGTQADKDEPIPGICDAAGNPRTGRRIIIHMGTEGARFLDPLTWVKRTMVTEVERTRQRDPARGFDWVDVPSPDSARRWLFSDVRFRNEAEAIASHGGVLWEVVRVGGPPAPDNTGAAEHPSELEWRTVPKDATLVARHGDLDGLRRQADLTLDQGGREHTELRG